MSGRLRRAIAGTSPATRGWLLFVSVLAGYVIGYKLAQDWFSAEDQGASFFPAAGVTLGATDQLDIGPRGFFAISRRNLWGKNRSVTLFGRVTLRREAVDPEDPENSGDYGFNDYRGLFTFREPRERPDARQEERLGRPAAVSGFGHVASRHGAGVGAHAAPTRTTDRPEPGRRRRARPPRRRRC